MKEPGNFLTIVSNETIKLQSQHRNSKNGQNNFLRNHVLKKYRLQWKGE